MVRFLNGKDHSLDVSSSLDHSNTDIASTRVVTVIPIFSYCFAINKISFVMYIKVEYNNDCKKDEWKIIYQIKQVIKFDSPVKISIYILHPETLTSLL